MLDRKEVERLGNLAGLAPFVRIPSPAFEELLRVYRAWLDAPAVDVEAGAGCLVAELVVPEVWAQLDGQRVRLVRDGDSGEGEL